MELLEFAAPLLFSKAGVVAEVIGVQGLTAGLAGFLWFKARKAAQQQEEFQDQLLDLVMQEVDDTKQVTRCGQLAFMSGVDDVIKGLVGKIDSLEETMQQHVAMAQALIDSMQELTERVDALRADVDAMPPRLAEVEKRETQQGEALTVAMNTLKTLQEEVAAATQRQTDLGNQMRAFAQSVEEGFTGVGKNLAEIDLRFEALEETATRPAQDVAMAPDPWRPEDPAVMAERLLRMSQEAQGAWQRVAEERRRADEEAFRQPQEVQWTRG